VRVDITDIQETEFGTNPEASYTDLDGISYGAELAYGTDPLDPQSVLKIITFGALNGGEAVTFSWTDEPDKKYLIEVPLDLSPDSWSLIEWDIESGDEITVEYINSDLNAIFYRVRLDH
jgi:hypothetical protein